MCDPDPGFYIPSPLAAVRSLASVAGKIDPRVLGVLVGGGVLVAFVIAHAVLITLAAAVLVGGVAGAVRYLQRHMGSPEWRPVRSRVVVTTRRGQGVRAITAGQRAIEAPRVVLPGQLLTAAEGEKVGR